MPRTWFLFLLSGACFSFSAQAARLRGDAGMMGPPVPSLNYDERWSGQRPTYSERKFNMSIPVMKDEKETMAVSLVAGQTTFGDEVILDNGHALPKQLSRVDLGVQYFHQLEDRKNWGVRGIVGSAGDELFKYDRDATFTVTAHYGFPGTGYGYWMWTVFLSNNSPLLNYMPLPGFVYFYKTETFTGLFGLPFANMKWTPNKDWTWGLSLVGVNLSGEAAYGSLDNWQIFTGFNWTRQSYILTDREQSKDRLTLEEKKAGAGIRFPILEVADVELQAGYSFDRNVYIGQGLSNKERGQAGIRSDAYVAASLKAGF